MPEPIKHHYVVELDDDPAADPWLDFEVELRKPHKGDIAELGDLMLDAYRGTIDYDGESIDEAESEVSDFFASSPHLDASYIAEVNGSVAGAILVASWQQEPLVSYVMTRPEYKNQGLGTLLLQETLNTLRKDGAERVHAFITDGNTASEALFRGAGARLAEA